MSKEKETRFLADKDDLHVRKVAQIIWSELADIAQRRKKNRADFDDCLYMAQRIVAELERLRQ